jgi:hypothetical protein
MQPEKEIFNPKSTAIGIALFLGGAVFLWLIAPLMGATPSFVLFYIEIMLVCMIFIITPIDPMIGIVQGVLLLVLKIVFWFNTNLWTTAIMLFIAFSIIIMEVLKVLKFKSDRPEQFGFVDSYNDDIHLLSGKDSAGKPKVPFWVRLIPGLAFTFFIALSVMTAQTIIVPIPSAFGLTAQQMADVGNGTLSMTVPNQDVADILLSSIPVAIAEDMLNLAVVVVIMRWFMLFAYDGLKMRKSIVLNMVFMFVALIAGAFLFSSAHYTNPQYISNPAAEQSATMFSIINIGIFMLTGLYLPLPHIVHNAIAVSMLYHAWALPFMLVPVASYFMFFALPNSNRKGGVKLPSRRVLGIIGVVIVLAFLVSPYIRGPALIIQTGTPESYCTLDGGVYVSDYCSGTTLWVRCDYSGNTIYKKVENHRLCGATECGDGYCDSGNGETYSNCPADCNPPTNPSYCDYTCTTFGEYKCEDDTQWECIASGECPDYFWNTVVPDCILDCCGDVCCENRYSGSVTVTISNVRMIT